MADPSVKEGTLIHDISGGKPSVKLHHAPGGSSSFNIFGDEPSNAIPSTYKPTDAGKKPVAAKPAAPAAKPTTQSTSTQQNQPQPRAKVNNKPSTDFLSWD